MNKQDLWKAIEAYRQSGGREEHWRNRDVLDIAIDEVFAECENVRRANLDCVDHFNALKADYDALAAKLEALEKQEPVAWQYDWYADDGEGNSVVMTDWIASDYDEAHSPTMGCHNIRPLFAAAPVATVKPHVVLELPDGDNRTARAVWTELKDNVLHVCLVVSEQPVATKLSDLPEVCDGKEQEAFEDWAKSQHLPMAQHPLHYLFLDGTTDGARQGWKAAITYFREAAIKEKK